MRSPNRLLGLLAASTALSAHAVPAEAQDAVDQDAAIQTEEISQLPELVVTASSREALREALSPGVVSVIYPDDVRGEHKALPDLLDQIPGVYARRVGGTGQYTTASIRGSAPSQVNIYIDGVPFNTASEVAADLSTIPMSNVVRVEVYRGATPARFSGAPIGGAINIVTRIPRALGGSMSAGVRSFDGWQASGSLTAPLFGGALLIGVDGEASDGDFKYDLLTANAANAITYDDADRFPRGTPSSPALSCGSAACTVVRFSDLPGRRTRSQNRFEKYNALVTWRNDAFTAKYAYLTMDREMPAGLSGAGPFSPIDVPELNGPVIPPGELANWQRRRVQTQSQHDFALGWRDDFGGLTLGVNLNASDQNKRFRNLDLTSTQGVGSIYSNYRTRRYGAALDATYAFGEAWPVSHRVEAHADYVDETLYADANNIVSSTGASTDYLTRFNRLRTSLQVQDVLTVRALGDLQVTPIYRVERLQGPVIGSNPRLFGTPFPDYEWAPTWGVSVKKNLGDGWQLFAASGDYVRYPNFYEIYGDGVYVAPGSDSQGKTAPLNREEGRNLDFGFGRNGPLGAGVQSSFRLTYFERKTSNTITYYATPLGAKYINSGTSFTRGGEFEGGLSWGRRADLQVAATVQKGVMVEGTYYYFGGHPASELVVGELLSLRTPDLAVSGRLNLHWLDEALTTFVEARHTGRVLVGQRGDDVFYEAPLTTIDIGARYRLRNGVAISAGVSDVFNAGPKQARKDRLLGLYQYNTCPTTGPDRLTGTALSTCRNGLNVNAARYFHQEIYDLPMNVDYAQQGRTFYFTLTKSFGDAVAWRGGGAVSPDFGLRRGAESWTGVYAGAHLNGWTRTPTGREDLVFDRDLNGFFLDPMGVTPNATVANNMFGPDENRPNFTGRGRALGARAADGLAGDEDGFGGGVRLGYDLDFGALLVGGLVEYTRLDVSDSVSGFAVLPVASPQSYAFTREIEATLAVRARIGVPWGGNLAYLTGGWAWGDASHRFDTTNTTNGFVERGAKSRPDGYQVGAGYERRIGGTRWTLGLEYLYTGLDDGGHVVRVGSNGSTPATDPFLQRNAQGTDMTRSRAVVRLHTGRVTLGYRF